MSEQYEVFCASSGQAALEQLAGLSRLDLILSDIEMPGMRGYEMLVKTLIGVNEIA